MSSRAEASWQRAAGSALCLVALSSFSTAIAAQTEPSPTGASTASRDFPKKLTITVVADERLLSTFQERVSSWFSDGTEVRVTVTSEVDEEQLLASSPSEVRAWIVPLSTESALLTFSCVTPPAAPRHLVRAVRLREGFDELGLERLASVTHSAFVALSEGVEGVEREQAARELGAVGVPAGPLAAPNRPEAPAPLAPPTPAVPPPAATPAASNRAPIPAMKPRATLLVAAGYGVRLRGSEGVGQGPILALGVQLQGARTAFDLQLSGQYLFSSEFEAEPFSASVQTNALRAQVGIEPRLGSPFYYQVLLGLGADVSQISASAASSNVGAVLPLPRSNGTQWRGAGELALGFWHHGDVLDLGILAQAIFAFEDVRYSATTSTGEAVLVRPWPVQPALSLQGRFRSAL